MDNTIVLDWEIGLLFQQYAPQGVRSRDVIHAAVMLNNGISEMISTDKHFDVIIGIRRIDPLDRI